MISHPVLRLVCAVGLAVSLAVLSAIDLQTQRLPDRIVLPLLWIGLTVNAVTEAFVSPAQAIEGAVSGYASLWLLAAAYRLRQPKAAFGGGDMKLAAVIGAWLGIQAIPAALLVAFTSGTCAVLPGLLEGRVALRQRVPFGPALALGAGAVLVWGPSLSGWLTLP